MVNFFIELTVTCGSIARRESNAAFALQQWQCESATVLLVNVRKAHGLC